MNFSFFLTKISPTRSPRPTRTLRRRGSIIVLVAGGMVMFLGCAALAVDYGFLVNDANRLQRACDAGALAGAAELRTTTTMSTNIGKAREVAKTVTSQNGFTVTDSDITFDSTTTPTEITVSGSSTRKFIFTVRGFYPDAMTQGIVRRAATAAIRAGVGTNNSSPIGITKETYDYYNPTTNPSRLGQEVTLTLIRQNKLTFAQGKNTSNVPNYDPMVLFDLRDSSGKSSQHFYEQFIGTELITTPTTTNFTETTLNAAQPAQVKNLQDGIETLFKNSAASPWLDAWNSSWTNAGSVGTRANEIINKQSSRSNPRVLNILVANSVPSPVNGTFDATIVGTVPAYLKSVTYTPGDTKDADTTNDVDVYEIKVIFLTPNTGGTGTAGSSTSTESEGANGTDGYVISLIR